MHHASRPVHGRSSALAPAAILLLALCLLAGGAQAATDPINTSATVAATSLATSAAGSPAAPAGYETPIVVHSADQVAPGIFADRIVWQDWRNNAIGEALWDIYSFDMASRLELPEGASIQSGTKVVPDDTDAAISGRGIFWVFAGSSDADVNNRIMGRTLAGEPINITYPSGSGYTDFSDLAADADQLVFVFYNGYQYRLVRYLATTDQYYYDRETANEIRSPAISGETVVWQEYDGNDWNVWAVVPGHGSPIALANDPGDQVSPAVDGTRVVWADNRSGDWDLWTADLSQQDPVAVPWLVAPGDQMNPAISGDRVVWQDNRGGDWDVWLGSLADSSGAPIADAAGDQEAPMVDGDRVVWQDHRDGNWDIYMFTVSPTGPDPVPTPAPIVITAPGTYLVAADGWDGTATPIEIRASDVVLDGRNRTIDGTGRSGSCGVLVSGAGTLSNVVVRNLRLTNWETGIRIANATSSTIEGCDVAHNRVGVALGDTQSVSVRDSRIHANDDTGVQVARSTDATVSDNDIIGTGDGFQYFFSTTMDIGTFAVVVGESEETTITGNDLGGEFGSLAIASSDTTRVTANRLTGRWVGVYSLSRSEGGLIANNLFRNFDNLYGAPGNASWNTTPSPGPNIVGGPAIGGNFWADLDGTGFSETGVDANRDGFVDSPYDHEWGGTDFLPLAVWSGPAPGPTPYKPHTVPGRIEGEDYDLGGEGVAYHDTTPGNSGGAYRSDDVDIERTAGLVTPNVGWIRDGEFLTYTVNVTQAGSYLMTVRVASPNSGRTFVLRVDGQEKGVVPVPKTGSFATFVTAPVQAPVTLSAGTHTLKLEFHGDGQNLDWIELTPVSPPTTVPTTTVPTTPTPGGTPYPSAHAVPGRVESEDYDVGGFSDTTPANEGGAYRQDAVDIERGGSGYNVGWIRPGEYLEYSVDTTGADNFQVAFRVANPGPAKTMTVRVNGEAKTLSIPSTGGFQNWQSVTLFAGMLDIGRNLVRIETGTAGSFNLDYMQFTVGDTPPPTTVVTTPTPTTPASGGASFVAAPTTAPKGAAVKFTVTPKSGKTIKSAWWSFDADKHLNTWNSRNVNPTFYYPAKGTFSPLVKLTYTDGSTETVQRANYIRAT